MNEIKEIEELKVAAALFYKEKDKIKPVGNKPYVWIKRVFDWVENVHVFTLDIIPLACIPEEISKNRVCLPSLIMPFGHVIYYEDEGNKAFICLLDEKVQLFSVTRIKLTTINRSEILPIEDYKELRKPHVCSNPACRKNCWKLQFCGKCGCDCYCNKECQAADWARHKMQPYCDASKKRTGLMAPIKTVVRHDISFAGLYESLSQLNK